MSAKKQVRAERRLTLLAAATEDSRFRAREQARALSTEIDRAQLIATLRSRRLLPTLGPRIVELTVGRLGGDFASVVEESIEAARRQALLLEVLAAQVTRALEQAGIPATVLKGSRLAQELHGDPGRRLSSDLDLLVASDRLSEAAQVVVGLGYAPPTDHLADDGLPLLHLALVHERGELPAVELHWRVHWYERSFARQRLLAGADRPAQWRPALADQLAALLLFYARDGFIDLRQAADVSAWWDRFGGELPPGSLGELIESYPALARPLRVSAAVAQRTVGLPARQVLGDGARLGVRGAGAVRLANPNPRVGPRQLYADRGLIDGLLMPSGELAAFMRRQVFLPRAVLQARAQDRPQRQLRSALGRNGQLLARCGMLGRFAVTLTRVARAPETVV